METGSKDDRWVLLGGICSECEESLMRKMGYSFWMSDLNSLKVRYSWKEKSGEDLEWVEEGIWADLGKICDGVKFDSFVEAENDFQEELVDLFPQIKKMEATKSKDGRIITTIRVKVYVWYNFRLNLQTVHSCRRGVLALGSSGLVGYQVLSHLRSTFSFDLDERRKPLLDLFNKTVIQGGLFSDSISFGKTVPVTETRKRKRMTGEEGIEDLIESFCCSSCKVLNCIEHLDLTLDLTGASLSVRTIMEYLNKEFTLIGENSVTSCENCKFDAISSLLRNDGSHYKYLSSNNVPIEVWWNIFDFLDDFSLARVGWSSLNKSFNFMWLTYHRNGLLPHQRRSVAWLLERESRSGREGGGHWSFESPVRYLTSSDDVFKYLSVWHYLKIKDISQVAVGAENLEKIITWESGGQEKHLMGVKMHPKNLFNSAQVSRTTFLKDSNISLYMNHASKTIHLGFQPKSAAEFRTQEYGQTRGGVFCDEPGLGKTLTILSLIRKTSNKVSNIHKTEGISYFEYPHGVIQFLYGLNRQGEFAVNFVGISQNLSSIKLTNLISMNDCGKSTSTSSINRNYHPCVSRNDALDLIPSRSTLIIVPNHLVQHWVEEIKKWYKADIISRENHDARSIIRQDEAIFLPRPKSESLKIMYPERSQHLNNGFEGNASDHDNTNKIYLFDDPSKDEIIQSSDYDLAKSNIVILSYRMLTKQFQLCKVKQNYTRASVRNNKNSKKKSNNHYYHQQHKDPFFRPEKSPILRIKWLRLIIDEGHNIGNSEISSTLYQQFIFKIKSESKWIMSGTPLPVSIAKSINTNLPNILKFLQLPIICDRTRDYEQESIRSSRRSSSKENQEENTTTNMHYQTHNSLLKWISKPNCHYYNHHLGGNSKLSPIGLFAVTSQIGSIIVLNQKNQCLRNYLPNLIGPTKKVIQPFIEDEFYIYNVLCELTQRNLFCTYFSQENVDSLLHPNNVNYRHEVIWNFRFASILGFTMNFIKDSVLDGNGRLEELFGNMNLPPIPYISVSTNDIQELKLMLENTHPSYENDRFHPPESPSRLEFVLDYFTNICLSSLSSSASSHYMCDSCNEAILFPLIIPCPKIHLVCIHCIMKKHGYLPIKVDLNPPNQKDHSRTSCQKGNKFYWPKRGPIRFCIVCGDDFQTNPDFFDRLQVPIQISYTQLKRRTHYSTASSMNSPATAALFSAGAGDLAAPKSFSLPLLSRLKALLKDDYKSREIEATLRELYQKLADIMAISDGNMNDYIHYLLPLFGGESSSPIPFTQDYLALMLIGLISLSSSKLRYVLHCILKNIKENPRVKILVVSSLWQQLDFLYYTLTTVLNIGTCRYYPHIPKSELNKSISEFKNTKQDNQLLPVLLLSIDIGSHGLDLSCVSNMYILDPISDESIENQTISRAHRIRPNSPYSVKVKYCLIQDTFEDMLYDYIQCKRLANQRKACCDSSSHEDDLDRVKRSSKTRKRTRRTSCRQSSSSASHGSNSHIRKHLVTILKDSDPETEPSPESPALQEPSLLDLDPIQLLLRVFIKQKKSDGTMQNEIKPSFKNTQEEPD